VVGAYSSFSGCSVEEVNTSRHRPESEARRDAIYEQTVASCERGCHKRRDRIAFVMAFKGVFLEGLEVIILVITLGTSAHRLGLAAAAAAVARDTRSHWGASLSPNSSRTCRKTP